MRPRGSAGVEAAVERCEADFGPVAGVLNSAGVAAVVPFMETGVDAFRKILDVNIVGSFIVARGGPAHERCGTGSIVNVSSVSGLRGSYGRTAYGASKGAIITMISVMANELAEFGIRVNAIAPGPIDTPMAKEMHSAQACRQWTDVVPMHRYGEPEELCGTVDWLLDPAVSGCVSGQTICVDGGFVNAGLVAHTSVAAIDGGGPGRA